MAAEVDPGHNRLEERAHPLADRCGITDEGQDAPVVRCVRGHVEKPDAGHTPHRGGDGIDDRAVAALGDVRDTLDQRGQVGSS
jgi:hypothetical protein